jgi:hypothetical protein
VTPSSNNNRALRDRAAYQGSMGPVTRQRQPTAVELPQGEKSHYPGEKCTLARARNYCCRFAKLPQSGRKVIDSAAVMV